MAKKTEQIIFDNDYPKLSGASFGELVAVINNVSSEVLKTKWNGLLKYDTLRNDGRYLGIQDGIYYMLLLFIGDNGLLIPTLRKQNSENSEKYNFLIGSIFEFVIPEDK